MIFHGIVGGNEREGQNPSWFNIDEIEEIVFYVHSLISSKRAKPKDIGIITPYRNQVSRVKKALKSNKALKAHHVEGILGTL